MRGSDGDGAILFWSSPNQGGSRLSLDGLFFLLVLYKISTLRSMEYCVGLGIGFSGHLYPFDYGLWPGRVRYGCTTIYNIMMAKVLLKLRSVGRLMTACM